MIIPLLVLAFLLVLNGFFAMAELAMMTARQSRLQLAASRGSRRAAAALALSREPTRFLSTVQVGITLIGILSGAFGERALSTKVQAWLSGLGVSARYSDNIALGLVVIAITYFSLVLGELVPKGLALAFPEAIATTIARPLTILSRIGAWPVKVLSLSTDFVLRLLRVRARTTEDVSEEDVKALVGKAASTGIFDPLLHNLFQRVFRMGDLTVGALMVPRADIIWIEEKESIDAVRILVGTSPYSHFPICRGSLDKLVGVVHIKDLIAYGLLEGSDFRVTAVAQKPLFVPETMRALKLLDRMQKSKGHIAFVVDEYGGTRGLITLNDVVRAVLGDIARPTEEPPAEARRRDDGSWLIDGSMAMHEMIAALEIPSDSELPDANTVAGLVLTQLGHIPVAGEKTTWHGFTLEVVDMDGTRIDKVLATRQAPASE